MKSETPDYFESYTKLRNVCFDFLIDVQGAEIDTSYLAFLGKLLSGVELIDKAYTLNLYHYLKTKADKNLSDEEKSYIIAETDSFIKPSRRKELPHSNKFAAAFLTYRLGYDLKLTSIDEARELACYIFDNSEHEARRNIRSLNKTIAEQLECLPKSFKGVMSVLDVVLLFKITHVLEVKGYSTFEDLFRYYQNNITLKKRQDTTERTLQAYYNYKQYLMDDVGEFSGEVNLDAYDIAPPHFRKTYEESIAEFQNSTAKTINERDLATAIIAMEKQKNLII
jgi:hypothetical protein